MFLAVGPGTLLSFALWFSLSVLVFAIVVQILQFKCFISIIV